MISFDRLDLNLLRVFDAVMEERSVVRASQRLHLSQSALSHALARLRDSIGEELFVRTGKGLAPTDYAMAISGPLRAALQGMRGALASASSPFQPASARRTFVIAASDYVCAILLPYFQRQLRQEAPLVDLVIKPSTRANLAEQIDLRRIDLAIGMFGGMPERLRSQALMEQDEVLVAWRGHPAAQRDITLDDLSSYPLAAVSAGGEEDGAVGGFIRERGLSRQSDMYDRGALELALAKSGWPVRLQTLLPHFLVIPALIEHGDTLAIVPRPLAKLFARTHALLIKELPYPVALRRLELLWHGENDLDPAHCWLRAQWFEAVQQMQQAA